MNNAGVIFKRALRDSRNTILGWGIGLAVYAIYVAVLYPFMQYFQELGQLLYYPLMKAFLGDLDVAEFTSPGGVLGSYFFLFAPLLLAILAVVYGLGITAAEEDRGTLDVLLSLPVPRWRLIVEKFAALIVILALILVITLVGFLIGLAVTPSLTINVGDVLLAVLNILPVTLFMTTLTLLLATVLRSRGTVGGIVAAIVVASYFLDTLSALMEEPLSNMRYASIFHYYRGGTVLLEGVDWGGFLLLTVGTAVLLGLSLLAFQRRDLGT